MGMQDSEPTDRSSVVTSLHIYDTGQLSRPGELHGLLQGAQAVATIIKSLMKE